MDFRTILKLASFIEVVFGIYNLFYRTQQRSAIDPDSMAGFALGALCVLYGQWLWITSLKMKDSGYKTPTASLLFIKAVALGLDLFFFITVLEGRHTTALTKFLLIIYLISGLPMLALVHSQSRGDGKGKQHLRDVSSAEAAALQQLSVEASLQQMQFGTPLVSVGYGLPHGAPPSLPPAHWGLHAGASNVPLSGFGPPPQHGAPQAPHVLPSNWGVQPAPLALPVPGNVMISGMSFRAVHGDSKMDPFVEIKYGAGFVRTQVLKNAGREASFPDELGPLAVTGGAMMTMAVKDFDRGGTMEPVGETRPFQLDGLSRDAAGAAVETFDLLKEGLAESQGQISVSFQFVS